ncbi:non-classical export protein Nce102 [Xylona heveae TC161]|uniref:Non-classical export protein Nce102 n=1 Tax=Xylona heveae (strain CBS 132557 / TC161) TaxID=1328760 RepID=A0A164ZD17_XYLHT|nr:non-classical export protein Nce102 [Xylona heveae TC161]KZF18949.1 non-classical export protein Nce102 [Xylona heveae TC161]
MAVSKLVNLTARSFQFIWTVIIMGLVGNMIATANHNNTAVVNYAMFVAAFSLFTLFYTIPASFKEGLSFHPIILLVVDLLNTIFFFCAGVALASKLRVHSCGNYGYLVSNSVINSSQFHLKKRCHEAQAVTAFMWFAFAAYLISLVISGMSSSGPTNLRSGGVRRGGPAMSQV